jgi:hypothetical protein
LQGDETCGGAAPAPDGVESTAPGDEPSDDPPPTLRRASSDAPGASPPSGRAGALREQAGALRREAEALREEVEALRAAVGAQEATNREAAWELREQARALALRDDELARLRAADAAAAAERARLESLVRYAPAPAPAPGPPAHRTARRASPVCGAERQRGL